jgi:hypothetical protein
MDRSVARPSAASESRRPRRWPMLAAAAVIAIGISLLFPAGRHQWALSIIRQPTHYTVLFFNRSWTLPTTAAFDSRVPLSFTIGNQQGRALNYRYVLRQIDQLGASAPLTAEKEIASGASWTVSAVVYPTCSVSPCTIEVSLPGHPETIDFLMTLTPAVPSHAGISKHSDSH